METMSNEENTMNEVEDVATEEVTPAEEVTEEGTTEAPAEEAAPPAEEEVNEEGDMFPRKYVERLRRESAGYRDRAKHADELAHRLHTALVRLDGRLADPEDLPFDEAHLDDADSLTEAITDLVDRKPGLRAQKIGGDVGAGDRGPAPGAPFDLISAIKSMR